MSLRSSLVWLAVFAALAAAGAAHAGADPAALASFTRGLDEQLAAWHRSPASIDRDELVQLIERKLASGETPQSIAAWMPQELQRRWLAFAPIAPAHAPEPLFQLPFDSRVHWLVSQGVAGGMSHTGAQQYAFDFVMPEGTPILAAKRGVVVRVVDGFTLCCRTLDDGWQTNVVYVLHPSGVFSSYAHLRKGIVVREGQRIEVGELLGYSGSTGYANAPHLHFSVAVRTGPGDERTIPIRFRHRRAPEGYVPKHWHRYENRPAPGVGLHVSIDGTPLVSGEPFPLPDHAPVRLAVELERASGERFDVTRSAATQYVALTPWSLRVDRGGRVQFDLRTRTWGFLSDVIERGVAMLTIIVRDEDGREGYFDVWFKFADVTLPAPVAPEAKPAGAEQPPEPARKE